MPEEYKKIPSCCEDNVNPETLLPEDGKAGFKLIEGNDIEITETESEGLPAFIIAYAPYKAPTLSLSTSPATAEVGDTIETVTFNGSVIKGKLHILSSSIIPTVSGLEIDDNFSFEIANVTSNALGKYPLHTLSVSDGDVFAKEAGVDFQLRMYQGFSALATLNEAQVKALINSGIAGGIKSLYGGEKTYTVPNNALLQYIWWVYPVETSGIVGATLSGLPFPLVDAGRVFITNQFGVISGYVLMRSAGAFGAGELDITIF